MVKGQRESVLRIPIVQGEYDHAHLCRLVGSLEIRGDQLNATLPGGSQVELTLELDRGGRLSARAMIISTKQVFEEIAQLLVPDATPEALATGLLATRERLSQLRTAAFAGDNGEGEPDGAARGAARRSGAALNPADPSSWGRVARNAMCPCGSGRKYKHCHGKV